MILIPVFVVLHAQNRLKWALVVFLAASLTDMLDGYIARKYNLITDFGKLFDPLADKLMVCTALICQCIAGIFPWSAVIVVMAKEALMVLGGAFMLKKNIVVYSNILGKLAQVFFIVSLTLSFFHSELTDLHFQADIILLWTTVVLAIAAMICYAAGAFRQLKQHS